MQQLGAGLHPVQSKKGRPIQAPASMLPPVHPLQGGRVERISRKGQKELKSYLEARLGLHETHRNPARAYDANQPQHAYVHVEP